MSRTKNKMIILFGTQCKEKIYQGTNTKFGNLLGIEDIFLCSIDKGQFGDMFMKR